MTEQPENQIPQPLQNPYQQVSPEQLKAATVDAYGNEIPYGAKSSVSTMNYLSILFGFLPGLFYWLTNKDKPGYAFVKVNAENTFNFALLVTVINLVLAFIPVIGWICVLGIWIFAITRYCAAANHAKRGEIATFPFKISLLS